MAFKETNMQKLIAVPYGKDKYYNEGSDCFTISNRVEYNNENFSQLTDILTENMKNFFPEAEQQDEIEYIRGEIRGFWIIEKETFDKIHGITDEEYEGYTVNSDSSSEVEERTLRKVIDQFSLLEVRLTEFIVRIQ